MSDYVCPACDGGFPKSSLQDGVACPWCEFMLGEAAEMRENGYFDVSEVFPNE